MSTEPGTAIERRQAPPITNDELDLLWRVAKVNALSKRFPDARSPEEAMAKILLGRDLGLGPMQSLTGIYIVEGKPQVAAVTLAAFIRRIPEYDYRVLEHDDEHCVIEFTRNDEVLGVSEFSMVDAKRAGLVKDKSGWVKYPRNMLFSRALSNGCKWFTPDATHGIPVYHEGEIEVSRTLDVPAPESISVADVVASLPAELHDRFWAAWGDAQDLRHGQVTVANAQMSLAGQSPEKVVAWLERVERDNDAARAKRDVAKAFDVPEKFVDADVVEEPTQGDPVIVGDSWEKPFQGKVDGNEVYHPDPGQAPDVAGPDEERIASLNVRLSRLYEYRDEASTNDWEAEQRQELEDEVAMVEGMIRAAGGELP